MERILDASNKHFLVCHADSIPVSQTLGIWGSIFIVSNKKIYLLVEDHIQHNNTCNNISEMWVCVKLAL